MGRPGHACNGNQAIANALRSLPSIQRGGLPRPVQVTPVAGSRYLGHQFARLVHGIGNLALARFLDLNSQFFLLLQQFLVTCHGNEIPNE